MEDNLRRLNNQLRVDFASSIHSTNTKRKREPTRTIYEEATHCMETEEKHRALKSMTEKKVNTPKRKHDTLTKSDIEENENRSIAKMINAAESLAQMSMKKECKSSHSNDEIDKIYSSKTTIETIVKAHEDTLAAKDYIIKSITAALAAKEELIRAQATLISTMQQCAAVRDGI
jgi:hypothetical protein